MTELKTKIGLEIHVQLKTKSKMFCRCDNDAQGKVPNTTVCPVCLGLPGTLPVANRQAIEWTIKTGLALGCKILETAKFDRKHYFYPDLPKGYQISQYDEPFCLGGGLEIDGVKVRLNRIHLEEDAGKLVHSGNSSLVDLNRAGTPLMEIVTEPDITTPAQAGDFLRRLQKIVRDVVEVSEASMEKGHMRCDANISVSDGEQMSQIIEIKNLNSFRFVEKALTKAEEKLKSEHADWPTKLSKETWGYDSDKDTVYLQRTKEEASDYRYFPDPDLPPINSSEFDLEALAQNVQDTEAAKISFLTPLGISEADAKILVSNKTRFDFYNHLVNELTEDSAKVIAAKALVHKYFPFDIDAEDSEKADAYSWAILSLRSSQINKAKFGVLTQKIHDGVSIEEIKKESDGDKVGDDKIVKIVDEIIASNPSEVERYRGGDKKLLGFFIGLAMKETKGSANPQTINRILNEKL